MGIVLRLIFPEFSMPKRTKTVIYDSIYIFLLSHSSIVRYRPWLVILGSQVTAALVLIQHSAASRLSISIRIGDNRLTTRCSTLKDRGGNSVHDREKLLITLRRIWAAKRCSTVLHRDISVKFNQLDDDIYIFHHRRMLRYHFVFSLRLA